MEAWAIKTLEEHSSDEREHIYTLDELTYSQTHDEIWNAAQNQLRTQGIIQNYLRMLWGKKILEWTPNPQLALSYMITLNDRYSLDGRDPNSYSGVFKPNSDQTCLLTTLFIARAEERTSLPL